MKALTEWRRGTDLIDVWIYGDGFSGKRLQHVLVGEGQWETREYDPLEVSQRPEPSLTLPSDVLSALVEQGAGILPPSAATERHLADAIKVRDRLLEKVVPPR